MCTSLALTRTVQHIAAVILTVTLMAGCRPAAPLANAHPSAESLVLAVLDAMQRGDSPALEALALSEREFRERVWPELPAARPERNLPFSYVWGDLREKSARALSVTLARHGRRPYELLAVEFEGVTGYGTYHVHRGTALRVRDGQGAQRVVHLCGSLIEQDGMWKVFSYVVD